MKHYCMACQQWVERAVIRDMEGQPYPFCYPCHRKYFEGEVA